MNYDSLKEESFSSFNAMFDKVRSVANDDRYRGLSLDRIMGAFGNAWDNNPYIQHTRLLRNRSQPMVHDRTAIENMLKNPENNEQGLRQVSNGLDYSSYPLYKLKKTTTDILLYKWFYLPQYLEKGDGKKNEYRRERKFIDKFCKKLDPAMKARILTQEALGEGKVFKYIRYLIDKQNNKVHAVDLQDLPSDWCKITGRNSDSYFTVSFNFTYFWRPGTNVDQFPPIFREYAEMLNNVSDYSDSPSKASKHRTINMKKLVEMKKNNSSAFSNISVEKVRGRYFFWVDLPKDECFVFGTDFTTPLQAPAFMGLFLATLDIAQYEYLQPQLLQIPMYAFLTGEIPYMDDKSGDGKQDSYKLSPTGKKTFESYFYQMMASNDTRGVDLFLAPAENMKLQNLQEVPNGGSIVKNAYQDFLTKAGVTGIQSSTDKPMAGMVATSQKIESRYADIIYSQFANMMNVTFTKLNFKFDWRFIMFGDIFSKKDMITQAKEGMTLGILVDTCIYLALRDMTLEDDYSASIDILESGVMDMRIPLVSSYSAKQEKGGLPPQKGKEVGNPVAQIDDVTSGDTEESLDKGTGENL